MGPNLQGEDYGCQLHVLCGVILLMILQLTGTISYYPPGLHQNTSQSGPRGITIHCVPLSPVRDYQDRRSSEPPLQLLECLLTSVIRIKLYLLPGQSRHSAANREKSSMNLLYYPANPKKLRILKTDFGLSQLIMASTFSGSTDKPDADTTCPKNLTSVSKKSRLLNLVYN